MASTRKSAFRAKRTVGGVRALKSLREYDSVFEGKVIEGLRLLDARITKNPVSKSGVRLPYQVPVQHYYPDAKLPNGVLVEVKGMFDAEDRRKLLLVREQNPGVDIRLVFMNPKSPIYKGSKTTYAKWCEDNGFAYTKGPDIPPEWLA